MAATASESDGSRTVREAQQGQGPNHREHDTDCDKRFLHYSSIRAGGIAGLTVSTTLGFWNPTS